MVYLVISLILLFLAGVFTTTPVLVDGVDVEGKEDEAAFIAVGVAMFGLPGLVLLFLGVKPMSKISIEQVQGKTKVARVEHTGFKGGHYVNTELHMGDRIFVVPHAAFSELEDGATYSVYCWQGVNEIFSLEKLR